MNLTKEHHLLSVSKSFFKEGNSFRVVSDENEAFNLHEDNVLSPYEAIIIEKNR